MADEALKLMAQIVISHASTTELTPQELLREIKEVYGVLASLAAASSLVPEAAPRAARPKRRPRRVKMVESTEAREIENEDSPVLGTEDYIEFMDMREG